MLPFFCQILTLECFVDIWIIHNFCLVVEVFLKSVLEEGINGISVNHMHTSVFKPHGISGPTHAATSCGRHADMDSFFENLSVSSVSMCFLSPAKRCVYSSWYHELIWPSHTAFESLKTWRESRFSPLPLEWSSNCFFIHLKKVATNDAKRCANIGFP